MRAYIHPLLSLIDTMGEPNYCFYAVQRASAEVRSSQIEQRYVCSEAEQSAVSETVSDCRVGNRVPALSGGGASSHRPGHHPG